MSFLFPLLLRTSAEKFELSFFDIISLEMICRLKCYRITIIIEIKVNRNEGD